MAWMFAVIGGGGNGVTWEMPTYMMLSHLSEDGYRMLRERPTRLAEVSGEIERLGAKVLAHYALLGPYDFAIIVEAPNPETMTKIALVLGSRGIGRSETITAVPIGDFIASMRQERE